MAVQHCFLTFNHHGLRKIRSGCRLPHTQHCGLPQSISFVPWVLSQRGDQGRIGHPCNRPTVGNRNLEGTLCAALCLTGPYSLQPNPPILFRTVETTVANARIADLATKIPFDADIASEIIPNNQGFVDILVLDRRREPSEPDPEGEDTVSDMIERADYVHRLGSS